MGGTTGARNTLTGRFLDATTSRLRTGGRIVGYQNPQGKFVNPGLATVQTIQYLGSQKYDVGSLSRLHSGSALSPSQRAVVQVHVDVARWNVAVGRFIQVFGGNMHRIVSAHALDLLSRIQARTPVDTGRLRNSFHVIMPNSSFDRFAYTDRTGRGFDGSLDGATTGPFEAGVGSNVEYGPRIESGSSKQAPHGMVAVSVREKSLELENEVARELGQAWQGSE